MAKKKKEPRLNQATSTMTPEEISEAYRMNEQQDPVPEDSTDFTVPECGHDDPFHGPCRLPRGHSGPHNERAAPNVDLGPHRGVLEPASSDTTTVEQMVDQLHHQAKMELDNVRRRMDKVCIEWNTLTSRQEYLRQIVEGGVALPVREGRETASGEALKGPPGREKGKRGERVHTKPKRKEDPFNAHSRRNGKTPTSRKPTPGGAAGAIPSAYPIDAAARLHDKLRWILTYRGELSVASIVSNLYQLDPSVSRQKYLSQRVRSALVKHPKMFGCGEEDDGIQVWYLK